MAEEIKSLEYLKGRKFRIRKLTERECFRLMGVDDKDIDKIQQARYKKNSLIPVQDGNDGSLFSDEKLSSISKSQQYKMAGNSIVVDVLYYIFDRMLVNTTPNDEVQLTLF